MKKSLLVLSFVAALAALVLPVGSTGAPAPDAVVGKYFESLRADRYDDIVSLLSYDMGTYFYARSFAYCREAAESASPSAWNEKVKANQDLLKLLPYWRQREFTITIDRKLVIGRHARVWFTYSRGGSHTRADIDLVLEGGEWRITSVL